MRLRIGGAVVNAEWKTVVACAFLIFTLFTVMLYGLTGSFGRQIDRSELMVQPTPIDQLLQRIMNDQDLDQHPQKLKAAASSVLRQKSKSAKLSYGIYSTQTQTLYVTIVKCSLWDLVSSTR
jgi:hypothetical protein